MWLTAKTEVKHCSAVLNTRCQFLLLDLTGSHRFIIVDIRIETWLFHTSGPRVCFLSYARNKMESKAIIICVRKIRLCVAGY